MVLAGGRSSFRHEQKSSVPQWIIDASRQELVIMMGTIHKGEVK